MHTLSTVVRRAAGAARFASASSAMPSLGRADGQRAADGSSYENYNEAATVYDSIRYAGGAEIIIGAFASGKSGVPLHKQSILDIGCGTGNYAAALQPHVARVTCLDGNPGMLAKCREKLGGEKLGSDESRRLDPRRAGKMTSTSMRTVMSSFARSVRYGTALSQEGN